MQRRKYTGFLRRLLPKTHLAHQKKQENPLPRSLLWAVFGNQPSPTEQTATLNPDMAFHEISIGSCSGILLLGFQLLPIQLGSSWSPRANNQGQLVIAQITKKLQSVQKAAGVLDPKNAQWNGTSSWQFFVPFWGMVKWPFGKVKWPPTRESKGHFESPGCCFFPIGWMYGYPPWNQRFAPENQGPRFSAVNCSFSGYRYIYLHECLILIGKCI